MQCLTDPASETSISEMYKEEVPSYPPNSESRGSSGTCLPYLESTLREFHVSHYVMLFLGSQTISRNNSKDLLICLKLTILLFHLPACWIIGIGLATIYDSEILFSMLICLLREFSVWSLGEWIIHLQLMNIKARKTLSLPRLYEYKKWTWCLKYHKKKPHLTALT